MVFVHTWRSAAAKVIMEQETYSVYCRLAVVQTRKRDEVQWMP